MPGRNVAVGQAQLEINEGRPSRKNLPEGVIAATSTFEQRAMKGKWLALEKTFCAIFAQRDLVLAAVAMQLAQFLVAVVLPDFLHGGFIDIAQDDLASVIQTAKRNVSVDEHGHCAPQTVTRFTDPFDLLSAQRSAPVVNPAEIDVVNNAIKHFLRLFLVRGLASCRHNTREDFSRFIPQFAERGDVLQYFGVIQSGSQQVELLGISAVNADLDFVQATFKQLLGRLTPQQVSVGEDLDSRNPKLFAISDSLRQSFVEQGFAKAMQVQEPRAANNTLLNHSLKQLLRHEAFVSSDG